MRANVVAHADWSKDPKKRWCAIALLDAEDHYRIDGPELVGELTTYFSRLLGRAGPNPVVLTGFDFPIGLPARYARKAGLKEFRTALSDFGRCQWGAFYSPSPSKSDISVTRPFYPQRRGEKGEHTRQHLVDALGLSTFCGLYRCCDRSAGRKDAGALFWLTGPSASGVGSDHWLA